MYLYETIADTLERSIERGQLPAGTRLASIRTMRVPMVSASIR
ncbi:hypothetical protein [Zymobacter palmae]|uniref:Transcriptional regulator, MocR family n=1 Tax=Zymobacter palmae TaxID=33074 RepID=A0A348HEQ9_9GAMM|nr:hypothetical protein [Zymobacter palmae]BBG30111.1 transcriptional regulator, MocR family [Zymobacter palmae]